MTVILSINFYDLKIPHAGRAQTMVSHASDASPSPCIRHSSFLRRLLWRRHNIESVLRVQVGRCLPPPVQAAWVGTPPT